MLRAFKPGIVFMSSCLFCIGCTKEKTDRTPSSSGETGLPNPRRADLRSSEADRKAVVQGANRFAVDLYARVRTEADNLFVSPWSITTALAMTYAGARTETAEEMKTVLHFPLDQARLHPAFGALGAAMEAGGKYGGYRLSMANRIWPKAGGQAGKGLPENNGGRLRSSAPTTRLHSGSGRKPEDNQPLGG